MKLGCAKELRLAGKQTLVWVINIIGMSGIFLIAYAMIVYWTGSSWPILERIARIASQALTLIGTVIIAVSVYLPQNTRPPDAFSRCVSAPIVLVAALSAFIVLVVWTNDLPPHLVNGFALLAISGSLFRLISR